jgi:hypothetical protein
VTIYEALWIRSAQIAQLTDQVPPLQPLIRALAFGAARWSEKTRQDVVCAKVQGSGDEFAFVVRISARESVVPIFRGVVLSTFECAARFVRENPDAVSVLEALTRWGLDRIANGAVRFDVRWSPGNEGFLAITAVAADIPKIA